MMKFIFLCTKYTPYFPVDIFKLVISLWGPTTSCDFYGAKCRDQENLLILTGNLDSCL